MAKNQLIHGRFYCSRCGNEVATYDALIQHREGKEILCGVHKAKLGVKIESTSLRRVFASSAKASPSKKGIRALAEAIAKEAEDEKQRKAEHEDSRILDMDNNSVSVVQDS